MRWAASTVVFRSHDWAERLGELREVGYEAVELSAAFGPDSLEGVTFNYTDPVAVEQVAGAVARTGIAVHSMHGPIVLGPPSIDGPFGEAGLEGLLEAHRAAIDAMMSLGGRFVVTQDAAEREPDCAPHLASAKALGELARYAGERGCVFCIENGAEDLDDFARLAAVVRQIEAPGLGICLDTGHAQAWGYRDVPRAIRAAGTALKTCHLHDNLGTSDAHLGIGDGVIPWHAVLEALRDVGYRGPFVCESWSGGGRGSVDEVLERSRLFLTSLCDQTWTPAAAAGGCDIYRATRADRERARGTLGPERVAADGGGPCAIAVNRFGEAVVWAEFEGPEAPRLSCAASARAPGWSVDAIARAMITLLLAADGAPPEFAADGVAARALADLGLTSGEGQTYRAGAGHTR